MFSHIYQRYSKWSIKVGDSALYLIILIILIAGGVYSYVLGDEIRYWDEQHYLLLSRHLHHWIYAYDGITPISYQAPGYPLTLWLMSLISDDLVFLRFMNFVFFSVSLVILYHLLKKYDSQEVATLGVFCASLYPFFFYTAGTFYPQTYSTLILMLAIYLVSRLERPAAFLEYLLGALFGWLCLIVPQFLIYIPFFALYPFFYKRRSRLRAVLLFFIGSFSIIGIWTARNYRAFDEFILISSNSGFNFYKGNSPQTMPNREAFVKIPRPPEGLDESDKDAYYTRLTLLWIKKNPSQALKLYFGKVLYYFNYTNILVESKENSEMRSFVAFITYYPLLFLVLLRLILAFKYPLKPFEKFLAMIFILSPFLHAVHYPRVRYRLPIDFMSFILAFQAIGILFRRQFSSFSAEASSIDNDSHAYEEKKQ